MRAPPNCLVSGVRIAASRHLPQERKPRATVERPRSRYTGGTPQTALNRDTSSFLEAALLGYEAQAAQINAAIAALEKRLHTLGDGHAPSPVTKAAGKKHRMSAEGRARIAAPPYVLANRIIRREL